MSTSSKTKFVKPENLLRRVSVQIRDYDVFGILNQNIFQFENII